MDINEWMGGSLFQEMLFTKAGGRSDLAHRQLADSSIPHRLWQFHVDNTQKKNVELISTLR